MSIARSHSITILGLCTIIAGLVMVPVPAIAEPVEDEGPPVSFSFTTDSWSGYWYRGMTVTDRLTVQPSAALCFENAGLELGFWSSYALVDRSRLRGADEVDLILSYSRPFTWAGRAGEIGLGYTEYFFTAYGGSSSRTGEMIFCASLDNALAPSLSAYYDVDLFDETYLEASIEPEIAIGSDEGPSIVLLARLGAGEYGEPFGLRSTEAGCGLRFRAGSISLLPRVGYGYAPAGPEEGESLFSGGFSVTFGE